MATSLPVCVLVFAIPCKSTAKCPNKPAAMCILGGGHGDKALLWRPELAASCCSLPGAEISGMHH